MTGVELGSKSEALFINYVTNHWPDLVLTGAVRPNSKISTVTSQILTISSRTFSGEFPFYLIGPGRRLRELIADFGRLSDNKSQSPKEFRYLDGTPLGTNGAIFALTPWTQIINDAFILIGSENKAFVTPFAYICDIQDRVLWDDKENKPHAFGRELILLALRGASFIQNPCGMVIIPNREPVTDLSRFFAEVDKIDDLNKLRSLLIESSVFECQD
jgi:hypothetical protein